VDHESNAEIHVVHVRPASTAVTARTAVESGVRAGFGVAALLTEVLLRALGDASTGRTSAGHPAGEVADAVLGVAWGGTRAAGRAAQIGVRVTAPVADALLHPPLVPAALHPGSALEALSRRWRADRPQLAREAARVAQDAVPAVIDGVSRTIDLDLLVGMLLERVDLDQALTTGVDRLDVDRLVAHLLDAVDVTASADLLVRRLDLDAVASTVVSELDLQPVIALVLAEIDSVAVAAQVMEGLPVDELAAVVVARLDVDAIVEAALDQVDLTALVVERVDLARLVTAALDQVDLTALVTERVDLARVVTTALDEMDLTALVRDRVDLIGLADYVVDEIDLPEIIRESTGGIATETVRGIRTQGVGADRAVARLVDRFTLRGGRARRLDAPGEPESLSQADDPAEASGSGEDGHGQP
jgi:hypothetical protein